MSKNILSDHSLLTSFLDRLQSVHEVSAKSPAAKQAQKECDRIFADAQAKGYEAGFSQGVEAGRSEGYAEGLARGKQEAFDSMSAECATLTQSLSAIRSEAEQAIGEWYRQAEERLSTLAIEIARRAIGKELDANPELMLDITRQALEESHPGSSIRLRVNPLQTSLVESHKAELLASLSQIKEIEVVADSSVKTVCIIESESGAIDARIDSFLDRLETEIEDQAA